jgi:hypothetical protein
MRVQAKSKIVPSPDGRTHGAISPLRIYHVLEVDNENMRVVDDRGEPILYPKDLFMVMDTSIPPGWEFREGEDGEYRVGPIRLARPGFYEDFFGSDGDLRAQLACHEQLREELETTLRIVGDDDSAVIEEAMGRLVSPSL